MFSKVRAKTQWRLEFPPDGRTTFSAGRWIIEVKGDPTHYVLWEHDAEGEKTFHASKMTLGSARQTAINYERLYSGTGPLGR